MQLGTANFLFALLALWEAMFAVTKSGRLFPCLSLSKATRHKISNADMPSGILLLPQCSFQLVGRFLS